MAVKSSNLISKVQSTGAGTTPSASFTTNAEMFGAGQGKSLMDAGKGMMDLSQKVSEYAKEKAIDSDRSNNLEVREQIAELKARIELEGADKIGADAKGWAAIAAKLIDKGMNKIRGNRKYNFQEAEDNDNHLINTSTIRFKAQEDLKEVARVRENNGVMITKQLDGSKLRATDSWRAERGMEVVYAEIEDLTRQSYENQRFSTKKGEDGKPSAFEEEVLKNKAEAAINGIAGALSEEEDDVHGLEIAGEIFTDAVKNGFLRGKAREAARQNILTTGTTQVATKLAMDIRKAVDENGEPKYVGYTAQKNAINEMIESGEVRATRGNLAKEMLVTLEQEDSKEKEQELKNKQTTKNLEEIDAEKGAKIMLSQIAGLDEVMSKVPIDRTKAYELIDTEAISPAEAKAAKEIVDRKHKESQSTKKDKISAFDDNKKIDSQDDESEVKRRMKVGDGSKGWPDKSDAEKMAYFRADEKVSKDVANEIARVLKEADDLDKAKEKKEEEVVFEKAREKAESGKTVTSSDLKGLGPDKTLKALDSLKKTTHHANMLKADKNYQRVTKPAVWEQYIAESSNLKSWGAVTAQTLIDTYKNGLDPTKWDIVLNDWKGTQRALGKATDKEPRGAEGMSKAIRVKDSFKKAGLDIKKDSDKYDYFYREFDERVRRGEVKTVEGEVKILDELVKEYIVFDKSDNWLTKDSKKFVGRMDAEDIEDMAGDLDYKGEDKKLFMEKFKPLIERMRVVGIDPTRAEIKRQFDLARGKK
jgi:hypothetical protein